MKIGFWHRRAHAPTPLYPTFKKRIDDAIDRIIRTQVMPWAFLTAGPPFQVETFDKKLIAYQGVEFAGSPEIVFWSRYIEPFLEHLSVSELDETVKLSRDKDVDARLVLPEVESLLLGGFRKVYENMTLIDQRLRGRGFPNRVQRKYAESKVRMMEQFLAERVRAEIAMWKPSSLFELWFARHKFLVWALPTFATIALSLVGLLMSSVRHH